MAGLGSDVAVSQTRQRPGGRVKPEVGTGRAAGGDCLSRMGSSKQVGGSTGGTGAGAGGGRRAGGHQRASTDEGTWHGNGMFWGSAARAHARIR